MPSARVPLSLFCLLCIVFNTLGLVLTTGCEGAPLLPIMFVMMNMAYNISLLRLIKISSAVVSSLASTVSGTTLVSFQPWHVSRKPTSVPMRRSYMLVSYEKRISQTCFQVMVQRNKHHLEYIRLAFSNNTEPCVGFGCAVPIAVYFFTLPLPYLGVASSLPTGFVAGTVILVLGMLLYAWTPSSHS